MFKVLIPAAALLGLTAFVAHPATSAYEPQTNVQRMAWHLHHEGGMAKLAYGVANSDQLAVMFTCEPGENTAVVYGDVQPDSPRLMRASTDYVEPDPLTAGEAYETRIALNDPALRGLAERGALRVEGAAGDFALPATAREQALASQFIAHCATARA